MKIDPPLLENFLSLVREYHTKNIIIPSIQRKKVWNTNDLINLLNSIYKGFPIGSVFLWKEKITTEIWESEEEKLLKQAEDNRDYLLDGQQRISSLTSLLYHNFHDDKESLIKLNDIYFNTFHNEAPFSKTPETIKKGIYNAKELFKGDGSIFEEEHWVTSEGTNNAKITSKIQKFMNNLRELEVSKITVETIKDNKTDYKVVADLFIAINKSGKLLTNDQLTMAKLLPIMKNIDKEINITLNHLSTKTNNFYPKTISGALENRIVSWYLGVLSLYCFDGNSVHTNKNPCLIDGTFTDAKFKTAIVETKNAITEAFDDLRVAGITDYKLLPHNSFLVVFTYLVRKFNRNSRTSEDIENLKKFIYISILSKEFFRTNENKIKQATQFINSSSSMSESIDYIVNELLLTNNVSVTENYYPLKNNNFQTRHNTSHSIAIKEITFLLIGASDWKSEQKLVRTDTSSSNRCEHHHIFPLKQLKLTNIDSDKFNYLANIAFVSGITNNSIIGDNLPEKYFPEINPKLLSEQFITLDTDFWDISCYDLFLLNRGEEWAEFVNKELILSKPILSNAIKL